MDATTPRIIVGRYTDPSGSSGLQRFRLEGDRLVREASLDLRSPSWASWMPDGRIVAVSELPDSEVSLINSDADGLALVSSTPTQGADACHVSVSPDGEHLAVANYGSGSALVVADPADGELDHAPRRLVTFEGSGPVAGRQDRPHAHEAVWIDAGTVLVNDLGSDVIRRLSVRPGAVVEEQPIVLPPGFGPRHLRLRGRDEIAVVGELSGELISLRHREGEWMITGRVSASGVGRQPKPSGVLLHEGGLIVGNREVDTVAGFSWDADGRLALEWEAPCGGDLPRDLQLGYGLLWVALQESGEVVAHRLDGRGLTEVVRRPIEGAARVLL